MPRRPTKIFIRDISRPIAKDEPVYPGNDKPTLKRLKIFKKDGSNLSSLFLGLHTATHLDAPAHYLRKGKSINQIDLSQCVGWSRVIDCTKAEGEINETFLRKFAPKEDEILLLKTTNSSSAKNKTFNKRFIHITEDAARFLVRSKIKAIGIDGPSIRKFKLRPDTVHPLLLRSDILVYEGLALKDVPAGRYYFFGVPLKINDAEASPVRAFLMK